MTILAASYISPSSKDHWILRLGRVLSCFVTGTSALIFILVALPALQALTTSHSTISKLETARRMRNLTVVSCGPNTTQAYLPPQPPPENESSEIEIKPDVVSTVQVRLPTNVRKLGLRGSVKVSFTVDAQGRVVNPTIQSSSNPALNQPTLDAIKQWRFEPGTRGGKRVPFKMMQPFNYG